MVIMPKTNASGTALIHLFDLYHAEQDPLKKEALLTLAEKKIGNSCGLKMKFKQDNWNDFAAGVAANRKFQPTEEDLVCAISGFLDQWAIQNGVPEFEVFHKKVRSELYIGIQHRIGLRASTYSSWAGVSLETSHQMFGENASADGTIRLVGFGILNRAYHEYGGKLQIDVESCNIRKYFPAVSCTIWIKAKLFTDPDSAAIDKTLNQVQLYLNGIAKEVSKYPFLD